MSAVEIKIVNSKSDLMKFIKFPWAVYKNDPYWVPPLIMDRKKVMGKDKNPFFDHAQAEYFLAYRGTEIVGRIAAIKNDLHNQYNNDEVGFFGFFECFNDQEAANALFDSAAKWLKAHGMKAMRGPANPSSNDEYGMLLEGFDDSPRLLMTYNPKYYLDLCDTYGLKKVKDLNAYSLSVDAVQSSDKLMRIAKLAQERYGLELKQLDMKDFKNEIEKVKYVYNKAWAPNWGFVPLTDKELDAMADDLKPLVEASLVLFGYIKGELIGFALTMLDYNEVFKTMDGKLFPFGWIKLLTGKKKITWTRVITLGIIPEHQRKGLDAVFYYHLTERAKKLGISRGEASWILEDNVMMNRGAEVMKGELYKKYRVYETIL